MSTCKNNLEKRNGTLLKKIRKQRIERMSYQVTDFIFLYPHKKIGYSPRKSKIIIVETTLYIYNFNYNLSIRIGL